MTEWLTFTIAIAAGITAVYVIAQKLLLPMWRAGRAVEEMVPVLREFTNTFKDKTGAIAILESIAVEFTPDSGSSLRDAIDTLTAASDENKRAAERLASNLVVASIQIETVRELAAQDRTVQNHLLVLLERLTIQGEEWTRAVAVADRTEAESGRVAVNLEVAQRAVEGVAADLADSHRRADAVEDGEPGAAADAAAKPE